MSQSSPPSWLTFLLSGGVVALLFGLFKLATDAKEDRIKALERQINDREESYKSQIAMLQSQYQINTSQLQKDKERLQQELDATGDLHQLLAKTLDTIKSQGVTGEVSFNLNKIEAYLSRVQYNRDVYNSMRNAAQWAQRQKDSWLQEISDTPMN
jgi:hypothetical protein